MSDEAVAEEKVVVVPSEEEGVFSVHQIAPIEAEVEVKPAIKQAPEGEEAAEDDDETNTYQTEPTVTINPAEIGEIAQRILDDRLKNEERYDASTMKAHAIQISYLIREAIKRLSLDRYRIIAHVTVGEKCDQDILMNFLYLWKHEFDHFAIAKFESSFVFATALVFLIYKQ